MIFAVLAIVLSCIVSVVVGVIAESKGRFGIGWFCASILFTPIIALLCLIALGDKETATTVSINESAVSKRECPHCMSMIDRRATVCAACTRDVPLFVSSEMQEKTETALDSLDGILAHWNTTWQLANGEFIRAYKFIHQQYFSSNDARYSSLKKKLERSFGKQDGETLIEVVKELKQMEITE